MTSAAMRSYRFALADQWASGLRDRMTEVLAPEGLAPVAAWPARARLIGPRRGLEAVAITPDGLVVCRGASVEALVRAPVWLLREGYADEGPVEVAGTFAVSSRLVADEASIWAFSSGQVERFDRDTLALDQMIGVPRLLGEDGWSQARILDITTAPCSGIWVLVASDESRLLVQLDRAGCVRRRIRLGCRLDRVTEVAGLDGGQMVALLSVTEQRVYYFDPASGTLKHEAFAAQFGARGRWQRMASDADARIAVLTLPDASCADPYTAGQSVSGPGPTGPSLVEAILFLDTRGEALQPAVQPVLPGPGPLPTVTDIALARDRVVLVTTAGALSFGPSGTEAGGAGSLPGGRHQGSFLTPVLTSLSNDRGEGWLRAECRVALPEGATLSCTAAGTSDIRLAERVRALAADPSMTSATRMAMVWHLLTDEGRLLPPMTFTGPLDAGTPVEVPLYRLTERMIWLRLDVESPQAGSTPKLMEMRVLYPDTSLMAMLPAVFQGTVNDRQSALRDLVGVIETTSQAIDARIAGIGDLVQPLTAPPDWLDRIAEWTDIPWHDALPTEFKRRLVRQAGQLIRQRGTRDGLKRLLSALLPDEAQFEIVDTAADYRPMILGGGARAGMPIPFLLAGEPAGTPRLGAGAVLGRTRLMCGDLPDPLAALASTVRITIRAAAAVRQVLEPVLPTIVGQVMPAGVRLQIIWRRPGSQEFLSGDGDLLDDNGPGALGRTAEICRTVVVGRLTDPFASLGRETGFTLS
ncbi:MAG: hypothetical protein ING01_05495 [Rhodobacter sp.]|nr:hypothetical protein [Rhodobacter sp.]